MPKTGRPSCKGNNIYIGNKCVPISDVLSILKDDIEKKCKNDNLVGTVDYLISKTHDDTEKFKTQLDEQTQNARRRLQEKLEKRHQQHETDKSIIMADTPEIPDKSKGGKRRKKRKTRRRKKSRKSRRRKGKKSRKSRRRRRRRTRKN